MPYFPYHGPSKEDWEFLSRQNLDAHDREMKEVLVMEPEISDDMYDGDEEESGGQLLAVFRTCPECHSTVLCLLESELKGCEQHNAVQEQSSVEMGMGEQKAMGQTMGSRNFGRTKDPLP